MNDAIVLGASDVGLLTLDLPALVESRMLIQANSGAGKSYAIRKLLEATHGRVQQIVIDLEGEFSTLREHFPYVIAGKGGDTPADPKSAKLLARKLMEMRASAICDLSELPAHERVRFVRYFLEALVAAPADLRNPCLVVVDEAHHFCPEAGQAESAAAIIDLCTRGRKRGLCAVLATQRLAKLHKDATAELINVLIGRTGQDIDQRRAGDVLGFATPAMRLALRDLEPGEFYAFGPAISRDVVRFKVGEVVSRHPRVGERGIVAPPPPTDEMRAVLAKLADLPGEAEQEARTVEELKCELTNTRRELTRATSEKSSAVQACDHEATIAELEAAAEHAFGEMETANAAADAWMEYAWRLRDYLEGIKANTITQIDELLDDADHLKPERQTLQTAPERLTNHALPVSRPADGGGARGAGAATARRQTDGARATRDASNDGRAHRLAQERGEGGAGVTRPQRAILDTLATFERLGAGTMKKEHAALFAGSSPKSSAYSNNLGALRTAGLIDYPRGGYVCLTAAGAELATPGDDIATDADLQRAWFRTLKSGPQQRILEALIRCYPGSLTKGEVAELTEASPTSSAFSNNLGKLRSLGLVEYPGPGLVQATPMLFLEGTR